uniref:Uncharacterized protein n=1 Tax=Ditylenchus dipsaci TaxID=166011 RepID=A0A915D4P6_9BILA
MSSSMLVFVMTQAFCFSSALPHNIYVTSKMSFFRSPSDPYTLFILGIGISGCNHTILLASVFLTIDPDFGFDLGSCGVVSSHGCIVLPELPLQLDKVANCLTASCVMIKYRGIPQRFVRLGLLSLNMIFATYFLYKSRQSKFLLKDRVVKVTLLLEIAFISVPSIGSQLVTMMNIGMPSPLFT